MPSIVKSKIGIVEPAWSVNALSHAEDASVLGVLGAAFVIGVHRSKPPALDSLAGGASHASVVLVPAAEIVPHQTPVIDPAVSGDYDPQVYPTGVGGVENEPLVVTSLTAVDFLLDEKTVDNTSVDTTDVDGVTFVDIEWTVDFSFVTNHVLSASGQNYAIPYDFFCGAQRICNVVGNSLDNVLTGTDISNTMEGGAGNDMLIGRGGSDWLVGGEGADTFVFDATVVDTGWTTYDTNEKIFDRLWGMDTIVDFQVGVDKIQVLGLGYHSFSDIKIVWSQGDSDTTIVLSPEASVTLLGVAGSSLSAESFLFDSLFTT
jgi:Ca2+-binding RTX toxin-like protein